MVVNIFCELLQLFLFGGFSKPIFLTKKIYLIVYQLGNT